uniref:EGF-like domain-containing protein n=1 Tax=Gongylonema pulchrum TaxID=637853 RepID=A0A183EL16_9BILA
LTGWKREKCDLIDCVHGEPDNSEQKCICERPYSGQFCEALQTADVYSYYNHKVVALGPIGALSIIPLLIILYGCERTEKSRQIRRVEKQLYVQNIVANRRNISTLLTSKTKTVNA